MPHLTLARIALDYDRPAAPAHQPPDPASAVIACEHYLIRCHDLMTHARTADERAFAQFFIDNAERQLLRWRAALERQGAQT